MMHTTSMNANKLHQAMGRADRMAELSCEPPMYSLTSAVLFVLVYHNGTLLKRVSLFQRLSQCMTASYVQPVRIRFCSWTGIIKLILMQVML